MAATITGEDGFPLGSMPDTSAAEAALKAKLSRKRTKTGCLTCRKRRIKCGEERPICKNCVKSKRHCEGYNQRVVFKPPQYEYQAIANGAAHITFPAGPYIENNLPQHEIPQPAVDPSMYGQLRPRPVEHQFVTAFDTHTQQYVRIPVPPPQQLQHPPSMAPNELFQPMPAPSVISPGHVIPDPFRTHHFTQLAVHPAFEQHHGAEVAAPQMQTVPETNGIISHQPMESYSDTPVTLAGDYVAQMYGQAVQPVAPSSAQDRAISTHAAWSRTHNHADPENAIVAPTPISSRSSRTLSFSQTPQISHQQWVPNSYVPRPELSRPLDYQPDFQQPQYNIQQNAQFQARVEVEDHTTPEYYDQEYHAPQNVTPNFLLNAAAVEYQDDDYYDIQSEEEQDVITSTQNGRAYHPQRILNKMLVNNQISGRDLQIRRYDTFLYAGILDKYKVENVANPLRNPATARVFAHFISVTGPSLSIFERHPRSTSVLFHEGSIPLSQQGLWTYTLPMAALHHQGLLHAMLALASLHIARLQDACATPSMQHYAWALKRVHASVSNPKSRLKLTTIAASMLLGFYEVMTADHMKWNMHLAGAKQLFVETDFVKMTQDFRRLKLQRAATQQSRMERQYNSSASPEASSQDDLLDQIPDIDERLVSEMIGREVRYGGSGRVEIPTITIPPELDLGKFEILKDLYWWYCKQDVYQSIISGNALL